MGDIPNKDEIKGRAKQAAGDLTDDDDLQREGTIDRAVAGAKDGVDEVASRVRNILGRDR